MKTISYLKRSYVALFGILVTMGLLSNPLWASPMTIATSPPPSHQALNAFNSEITGTVTATKSDENLFAFDVSLDDPYLFGEFFVFLAPGQSLATPALADMESPAGWTRFGYSGAYDYVAFAKPNMSDAVQSQDGFKVRLNNSDSPLGYGFHVKEKGGDNTYFATLIPEPTTLLLVGTGLAVLLRRRAR